MKKIFLLLCMLFILPVSTQAEDTIKVGAVDLQKVVYESEAGKKAISDLEALGKSKQSTIDEKRKVIEKLQSELEKQASALSSEAKKNKEDELEKLFRDYQRTVQDSQAEVKKREGELREAILKGVLEIVAKIGEEEGYTIIIEKGSIPYSNKDVDITDNVIKKYNNSNKK